MPDISVLAVCAAIIFAGSAVQGSVGFGMGLAAVPVLLRFLAPTTVTPLITGLAIVMNLSIFLKLRHDADWSLIRPLLIGSFVGVVPGSLLPSALPLSVFKMGTGVLVIVSGVLLWLGWRCSIERKSLRFCVGALSGFLNGCISLSGPPVAIFLSAGDVPKNVFRASMSAYFLSLNIATMAVFAGEGILDVPYFALLGCLAPVTALGTLSGVCLSRLFPERIFRAAVMVLIIVSGLTLLF